MNWKLAVTTLLVVGYLSLVISAPQAQGTGLGLDPMAIGVGARPLGMGRAYVGVAEDADAIFMNPAGIARITNPKLSSMYAALLNDADYMVVGGAYPFGGKSALGAGIINSSTASFALTNASGEATGSTNWGNTVLFLSYGTYLNALPVFARIDKDILIGGSLKYHRSAGTASGPSSAAIEGAAGSAYSVDLGLLYPATDYLTLGANFQNAASSALGRNTSVTDTIPRSLKIGGKLALLGRAGRSYATHQVRRLYANVDYDFNDYNLPNVAHYGVEFWPAASLALRLGSDNNELTAGLGLRFSGIEFDYAYHPFAGVSEDTTHFFSIGYLGEANKRLLRVQLDSPADKSVIHDDNINVSGRVEVVAGDDDDNAAPVGVLTVKANGVNLPVNADLAFSADIPVDKIGKNLVLVEAADTAGDLGKAELRVVRLIDFADVPDGYWAKAPIENTGTVGLVEGYPDGSFRPNQELTRAELATLLVRAKGLKLPERPARKIFKDVDEDFWGAKYIEVAQLAGLVKGYPDGTFRANNKISKAEGIAVAVRFDNLRLAEVVEKPFWDVKVSAWSAKYIQAAKDAGLLTFVANNRLRPTEAMVRSEAVDMLSKTNLAGGKIEDLYSWEKGFKRELTPERPQIKASLF